MALESNEKENYCMLLPVRKYPDPILRQRAQEVSVSMEANLLQFTQDMLETMYANNGVGLAAPQVGVSKRIVVIDVRDKKVKPNKHWTEEEEEQHLRNPRVLINPVLTFPTDEMLPWIEGCLSVDEDRVFDKGMPKTEVIRHRDVMVEYTDLAGNLQHFTASNNLLAICVQHEYDHLNGKLFIDYLPTTEYEKLE